MTSKGGVYSIRNKESGKIYVGQSVTLKKRRDNHKYMLRKDKHSNHHLQSAWNKYGEAAFEFMVCEYVENARDNPKHLTEREQYWLDWHRLQTELYNKGPIAASPALGLKRSPEVRHKMSESHIGHTHSEETKHKLSELNSGENNPMYGKHHTEETNRKNREAHLGRNFTEEHKRKIGLAHQGRVRSAETKHNMRKPHKHTPAGLERLRLAHAKPYPAFYNMISGETTPASTNLKAFCRSRGLHNRGIRKVVSGERNSHKDWVLLANKDDLVAGVIGYYKKV